MRCAGIIALLALLVVPATCTIPDLVSSDRTCSPEHPCAPGYVCDLARGRCARSGDALPADQTVTEQRPGDAPPTVDRTPTETPPADQQPTDKRPPDKAPPCPTTWRASLPGQVVDAHVDPADGSVYVGGTDDKGGMQLVRLDKCGAIVAKATFGGAGLGVVTSVGPLGATQLVVGGRATTAGVGRGLVAVFDKSLALKWSISPTLGTTSADEIWDVTQFGQTIWAQGTLDTSQPVKVWEVRAPLTGGSSCSFSPTPANGVGRRVWTDGAAVYATGGRDANKGFVRRYTSACGVLSCASCAPVWETSFQDGTIYTEGRDVVLVGGNLYVAGFSLTGTAGTAQIFRIDPTTGATLQLASYDPTPELDLWDASATDGSSLYVAGVRGRIAGKTEAAVVRKVTMPGLQTQWTVAPVQDAGIYRGVALTPDGGVILVGGSAAGGFVRRCSTAGGC